MKKIFFVCAVLLLCAAGCGSGSPQAPGQTDARPNEPVVYDPQARSP